MAESLLKQYPLFSPSGERFHIASVTILQSEVSVRNNLFEMSVSLYREQNKFFSVSLIVYHLINIFYVITII